MSSSIKNPDLIQVITAVRYHQTQPSVTNSLSSPSVHHSPVRKWTHILTWLTDRAEVTIVEHGGLYKCRVIEKDLLGWTSPLVIQVELKDKFFQHLSLNCEPNPDREKGFVRFSQIPRFHNECSFDGNRLALINKTDDLIWRMFNKRTNTISYAPLQNTLIYNKNLTIYNFQQLFETPECGLPKPQKSNRDLQEMNQSEFEPISTFLKHISSDRRESFFLSCISKKPEVSSDRFVHRLLNRIYLRFSEYGKCLETGTTADSFPKCLSYFKNCRIRGVEISETGSLKSIFLRKPVEQSRLDSNCFIDTEHWAVTVVDTGKSSKLDFGKAFGHAALNIEGIDDDGYYFMHYVTFSQSGVQYRKNLSAEAQINASKYKRTETWLKEKHKVKSLLEKVESECEGESSPRFYFAGRHALVAKGKTRKYHTSFDNCITFINQKLEHFLGIKAVYNMHATTLSSPKWYIRPGIYKNFS